jgi:hypothetical protein
MPTKMINRTLYLIYLVISFFSISSCSVYGPAYQGQQLAYMETPNNEGSFRKVNLYAGGNFGNGATYQPYDKNTNGSLSAHIGGSAPHAESAFGIYAFTGKYVANINNIEKSLMYNGLGVRMYGAKVAALNDQIDFHYLGCHLGFHFEDGDFPRFKDTTHSHHAAILLDGVESAFSITSGLSMGLRFRLQNGQSMITRYLFGGTSTTFFLLPDTFFHHFTVNYQFKKVSVNASLVIGKTGRITVNVPFQLGVSVPLHSN